LSRVERQLVLRKGENKKRGDIPGLARARLGTVVLSGKRGKMLLSGEGQKQEKAT